MGRRIALVALLAAVVSAVLPAAASGAIPDTIVDLGQLISIDEGVAKSDNVHPRAHISFKSGTDIDFADGIVYASEQGDKGGVHVIDVTGRDPKKVAFIQCGGYQNDVAVVRPGLIALGYAIGDCGHPFGGGIRLIDVKDPKKPVYLGAVGVPDGSHTLTAFPGKPLIYISGGGVAENDGIVYIVDVSDPRNPKIVNEFFSNPFGCHDISFHAGRKLGFCPGQAGTEIWDVSDPVNPSLISLIPPAMEFAHSAVASPDGDLLLVSDESYVAHDCTTGRSPIGALTAFDITNPALPIYKGSISSPRGASPVGNLAVGICGAHNFNFVDGTRKVVSSWYTGGTSVIDFSDPSAPVELAYYRPDNADTWSSYFYRGYVIANDQVRGVEFLTVDGLPQPPPPPAPPNPPKDPDDPDVPKDPIKCKLIAKDEVKFAKKVNRARDRRDLRLLGLDVDLSHVAAAHSREMRRRNELHHTPEAKLRERVTRWEILAENVGRGASLDSLHEAFMESEAHRSNVTYEDFRHMGVGIARDGDVIWITVLFEAVEDPGTTMEMPKGC